MYARRHSGFSLIELIITLAVIGIAAAVAVPSFAPVINNRRVSSAAQDLYSSFIYARSEAIKRNAPISVTANNGDWSDGWTIADPAALTDAAQNLRSVVPKKIAVSETENGLTDITYGASGRLQLPAGASFPIFSLCDSAGSDSVKEREISFDPSGRPTIRTTTEDCNP